jgi:putative hydrolase
MVERFRESGVTLLAASDARYAAEVGHWQYLRRI